MMTEHSKQICEKWGVNSQIADLLCVAYEKGDSPYYLAEYDMAASAELDVSVIREVYDYLDNSKEIEAKRKRVINAYKKVGKLTPALEKRISLVTDTHVLDDILIPLRPNPQSKGQKAAKKGVGPLADLIIAQTEEVKSLAELATPYIGKDPSLTNADEVIQAVKDLLAERFAHDDTVRTMAREFMYEDGFYEVLPKNSKDDKFAKYVGNLIPMGELTNEELLRLFAAEDKKLLKLKLDVQIFRITELFRQHFIENPDSTSFDCICEVVDDMWTRLLHPSIEEDVKGEIRAKAERWAADEIKTALTKEFELERTSASVFVVDMSARKDFLIVAVGPNGDFLGSATDRKPHDGKSYLSERLRQFFNRHSPGQILALEGGAEVPEKFMAQINDYMTRTLDLVKVKLDPKADPCKSEYMKQREFSILDDRTKALYGLAITYLRPVSLVTRLGLSYYSVHALQDVVPEDKFLSVVGGIIEREQLVRGISIKDLADSPIAKWKFMTEELLAEIKAFDATGKLDSKNSLKQVKGMTDSTFRNIAGFVLIPNAENLFDRSAVHPEWFPFLDQVINDFIISHETVIATPDVLLSVNVSDPVQKAFMQKKLIPQLQVAQRYLGIASPRTKKKSKLVDLKEGTVVSGKVTNITPFGVFVNINAVCDGLIHISQLADDFVEASDSVVSVGDRVDVRILKVDTKKRRISLSMKNIGFVKKRKRHKGEPTKGQLNNLAEHFKNR